MTSQPQGPLYQSPNQRSPSPFDSPLLAINSYFKNDAHCRSIDKGSNKIKGSKSRQHGVTQFALFLIILLVSMHKIMQNKVHANFALLD